MWLDRSLESGRRICDGFHDSWPVDDMWVK